mgnify:CR=1 FL=1
MEEMKTFASPEEALTRKEEVLKELEDYNNKIFDETEESKTEEFSENYAALSAELTYIDEYLRKAHYKKPVENESILNKASIWIWFLMAALVIITIYPLFKVIDVSIIVKFLKMESVQNMTTLQQKTVLICSFLIYPVTLFIVHGIASIFTLKKEENKKVYLFASIPFWLLNVSSSLVVFFTLIFPTLKDM